MLAMPEMARDQLDNALSLAPDDEGIRVMAVDVAWRIFATVTDAKVRRDALQRIVRYFTDRAADYGENIWNFNRGNVGWAHFWLARYKFELLDFTTAQSGFETAYGCRYMPILSLASLCEVYSRCGAFDEAEGTYTRVKELAPGEAADESPLLSLKDDLKQLYEQKPPAYRIACAYNRDGRCNGGTRISSLGCDGTVHG